MSAATAVGARSLDGLFAPRSVALVGASDGSAWSRCTFANLARGGFAGPVHCVSPTRPVVHGQPAFPSLAEVPGPVDLAVVLVGTDGVEGVLGEAADRGIANLVVIASGFAETGEEGVRRQQRLVDAAAAHGQALLGPNNLGFVNVAGHVHAFCQPMPASVVAGGTALLSQSGAMGIFALTYLQARDVGLSLLVTLGNEATLTVTEAMAYALDDPGTRVIALFVESIRHPDRFAALARRALDAGKPVVVCKVGRSDRGARAAAAHTGALVGDQRVFSAAMRQLGVVEVDSLEALVATAGLLDRCGELPGSRLGVVTASGAACGVVGDVAAREGVALAELGPATVDRLRELLPPFATPQNPLDLTGYKVVRDDFVRQVHEAVAADPEVDVLVVTTGIPLIPEAATEAKRAEQAGLAELAGTGGVPVVLMDYLPKDATDFSRSYRRELALPAVLPSIEQGIPAIGRALRWSAARRGRRQGAAAGERPGGPSHPVLPGIGRLLAGAAPGPWSEARARDLLFEAGVPVVPGLLAVDPEEAVLAAEALGYPVAVKVCSPDIPHKSDVGGIRLGVAGPADVAAAFDAVTGASRRACPDARVDGALVTAMRPGGIELLVSVVRDPAWGPVLTVGLGGVHVEVMGDAALRLLPAGPGEIRAALEELRAAPLLHGARGRPPADLDAVVAAVAAVGAAGVAVGERLEVLEVNPLVAHGSLVEALDVLLVTGTGT